MSYDITRYSCSGAAQGHLFSLDCFYQLQLAEACGLYSLVKANTTLSAMLGCAACREALKGALSAQDLRCRAITLEKALPWIALVRSKSSAHEYGLP